MKIDQLNKLLKIAKIGPSKWELDEIQYFDRLSNPETLIAFFNRIKELKETTLTATPAEKIELTHLLSLLEDMDYDDCVELLNLSEDEKKTIFIENLARKSAIEVLTLHKVSFETMTTTCKLSPNDFILCAKRTQDLITAIQGLVIKGETLSKDVAGA